MNTQENITQENPETTETKKVHKIMDRPILSTVLLYLFVTLVTVVFQLVKLPIWDRSILVMSTLIPMPNKVSNAHRGSYP